MFICWMMTVINMSNPTVSKTENPAILQTILLPMGGVNLLSITLLVMKNEIKLHTGTVIIDNNGGMCCIIALLSRSIETLNILK